MSVIDKTKGFALIEVIVASTIFLLVFVLSLDTITRITTSSKEDDIILIEADYSINLCLNRYSNGLNIDGAYKHEYDWGNIDVLVSQYKEYADLQEIVVSANIKKLKKKVEYRRVVLREYGE